MKDLTGKRFGRLQVIARASSRNRQTMWLCFCDCGTWKKIAGSSIIHEVAKSCGCLRAEIIGALNRTHGMNTSKEYRAWAKAKERCYDPNCTNFDRYGGRGIKMCDEWIHSFENFFAYMGLKPSSKHEIDRFPDNDGDYAPGNCRWATKRQSLANRECSLNFSFNGETMALTEWAEKLGIKYECLYMRLRSGWPVERAFTTPTRLRGVAQ